MVMNLGAHEETALIGHTGFVGSNLLKQTSFAHTFNSANHADMRNREFDLVVCAGVSAAKWLANRDPHADKVAINRLQDTLATIKAGVFVLISTIDVYKEPRAVTENDIPTAEGNHAYGAHRYQFEEFALAHFSNVMILRLPALFGPGLKKNPLFDLMNDSYVDQINPDATFQWYPVERLWLDAKAAAAAGLKLFNISTEPLTTATIVEHFFPGAKLSIKPGEAPGYDMWSLHARKLGGQGHYLMNKEAVLKSMASFVSVSSHAYI